jgi:hypothetical protein
MRRDNTNPSKVSSSRGIFKVGEKTSEHVDVSAVPLADPPAVAELAGDSPDLA